MDGDPKFRCFTRRLERDVVVRDALVGEVGCGGGRGTCGRVGSGVGLGVAAAAFAAAGLAVEQAQFVDQNLGAVLLMAGSLSSQERVWILPSTKSCEPFLQ